MAVSVVPNAVVGITGNFGTNLMNGAKSFNAVDSRKTQIQNHQIGQLLFQEEPLHNRKQHS